MTTRIFQFDTFELFVQPAPTVEPSHQVIGVSPATDEAIGLLRALTGAKHVLEVSGPEGSVTALAQHDERADARLVTMVDIIAAIRRASPDMVQITITGMEENG